jgi:hypothetical protein
MVVMLASSSSNRFDQSYIYVLGRVKDKWNIEAILRNTNLSRLEALILKRLSLLDRRLINALLRQCLHLNLNYPAPF